VTRLTGHARPLIAALAIVALAAGSALAAGGRPATQQMPAAAASGLQRAAEAAGKTVPVSAPAGADQNETDETEAPETEAPPVSGPAPAPTEHPANHGADVSKAAQAETPAGFANHGQYVRSIAMANHGQTVAASHRNAASNGPHPNH
jgi:hypothetical protein